MIDGLPVRYRQRAGKHGGAFPHAAALMSWHRPITSCESPERPWIPPSALTPWIPSASQPHTHWPHPLPSTLTLILLSAVCHSNTRLSASCLSAWQYSASSLSKPLPRLQRKRMENESTHQPVTSQDLHNRATNKQESTVLIHKALFLPTLYPLSSQTAL